ncbi:MAG: hypothetical protein U0237_15850 [Thermoleophilia bacterium]
MTTTRLPEAWWVRVEGGIDPGDEAAVMDALTEVEAGTGAVLDVRDVEVFGAAAARTVMRARRVLAGRGSGLQVVGRPIAARVLAVCGVPHRPVAADRLLFGPRGPGRRRPVTADGWRRARTRRPA